MATTNANVLVHERSTLTALESDLQNREIGLDFQNKALVAKFNDGTKLHLISQEQTAIALAAQMTFTGTSIFSGIVSLPSLTANRPAWVSAGNQLTTNSISGTGTTLVTNTNPTIAGATLTSPALSSATLTSPTMTTPSLGAAAATSINFGGTTLSNYDEGTFTASSSDFTVAQTGTAKYTRIGKNVTLMLPYIAGTSNVNSFGLSGLPAAIWPASQVHCPIFLAVDNSVTQYGKAYIQIATNGTMALLLSTGNWTASGTKGLGTTSSTWLPITYTLQ